MCFLFLPPSASCVSLAMTSCTSRPNSRPRPCRLPGASPSTMGSTSKASATPQNRDVPDPVETDGARGALAPWLDHTTLSTARIPAV